MDELIQLLAGKLGIDASAISGLTDKVMAIVKENAGDDLFDKIASAIPGASEAAASGTQSEEAASASGGMLGGLASAASSMLGGSAASGLELGAMLKSAGLDASQIATFMSTIIEFVKEKAGDDVVDQLLVKFPMLKSLLG